jgi:hypothetical protein
MKKLLLFAFVLLMLPAVTCAQEEKTLYDISHEALITIEAYCACAKDTAACDQNDARALKSDAAGSLRDIVLLVGSGRFEHCRLTSQQSRVLGDRIHTVRESLVHISLLDGVCNRGIIIMDNALNTISASLYILDWITSELFSAIKHGYLSANEMFFSVVIFVGFTIQLLIGIIKLLCSFLVMISCLF